MFDRITGKKGLKDENTELKNEVSRLQGRRGIRMSGEASSKNISDLFDLFSNVLSVHSPIEEITPDFTLSDLKEETTNNKAIKFVRDIIKSCKILDSFIIDKTQCDKAKEILMSDVYTTVIMSRATGGRIIEKILMMGVNFGGGTDDLGPSNTLKDGGLMGERKVEG